VIIVIRGGGAPLCGRTVIREACTWNVGLLKALCGGGKRLRRTARRGWWQSAKRCGIIKNLLGTSVVVNTNTLKVHFYVQGKGVIGSRGRSVTERFRIAGESVLRRRL
jgi:hypothetical protein